MAKTRYWARANGAWTYVDLDNHDRLHAASHATGSGDAFASSHILDATVKNVRESGGPTTLALGAVTDGQYLKRSGTSIVGDAGTGGGGSTWTLVSRSGDSAGKQDSTLAADTTLLFPITASATLIMFFHAYLLLNSVNITMGAKFGWTVPASATMNWGFGDIAGSAANAGFIDLAAGGTAAQPFGAGGNGSVASANNGLFMVHLAGWVRGGGTSGNVTLTWAQSTTNANNLIMKSGSFIQYATLVT